MTIKEPKIRKEDILPLPDPDFHVGHVCIVTGAGGGIGRATAIAAAANDLMTVGLDIDEKEGNKTQQQARDMGGQMIFIRTDLTRDKDLKKAVAEAAKLGPIKYLANIAGIQHIDSIEDFPMEKYRLHAAAHAPGSFSSFPTGHPPHQKSKNGTGAIGNMASIHAHICTLNKPVYNITKFGLRALTQSIAAEGMGKIRAFSVSTGFVKTALTLRQIPAQAQQRGISSESRWSRR